MKTKEKKSGTYVLKNVPNGKKALICCEKVRSAIFINVADDHSDFPNFRRLPKKIMDEHIIEDENRKFPKTTTNDDETSLKELQSFVLKTGADYHRRKKRIRKIKSEPPENHHKYKNVWKAFNTPSWTINRICKEFKIGSRKANRIVMAYKNGNIPHEHLDNIDLKNKKAKMTYVNEKSYIEFIKNKLVTGAFDKGVTIVSLTNLLNETFKNLQIFKRGKVHELMKKAGMVYRRVKVKIVPVKQRPELQEEKSNYVSLLVNLLFHDFHIVFLDETYVSNILLPTRAWFPKYSKPELFARPKDGRLTIIAAVTMDVIQGFQIIYDSIDAIHFANFVLNIKSQMELKYPGKRILFAYDNAKPHVGKICGQIFTDYPYLRQSAYSPETNVIENIFGFFKTIYRKENLGKAPNEKQETTILNSWKKVSKKMVKVAKFETLRYLVRQLQIRLEII